jgi:hypothetical protein
MLRLVTDNDFDERIVSGLLSRRPALDIIHVRDVGLRTAKDPAILAWAAEQRRILLTHDRQTMPDHAYERVRASLLMPGVFVVDKSGNSGTIIDELLMADEITEPADWTNQVEFFPL